MRKKYLTVLPWCCLIGIVCFLILFMWYNGEQLTDSDISSEMILGRLLLRENAIITKNWYYSTEIKIINTQLIYSFLFRFFDNWTVIRVLTCAISYLIMLGTYYYLLCQMGYKKYFAISAIFLFLPLSDGYFEYVLLALVYATYICSTFLVVGMMFHYKNASNCTKRLLLFIMTTLSFLFGMGGARHVIILYLPMLVATIIMVICDKKSKGYLLCSVMNFLASGIGYLVNAKVLSKSYHFLTWNDVRLQKFSLKGIYDMFFGVLRVFGYSHGEIKNPMMSAFSIVLLGVTLVCVFRCVIKKMKSPDKIWLLAIYMLCAFIVFGGIYTCTNMLYADRYGMSVIIFAIPIIVINICEAEWNKYIKIFLEIILISGILLGSGIRYANYGKLDKTEELRAVTDYIVDKQQISTGYATFWNANVLTELSDGYIDMYCWDENVAEMRDMDDLLAWLQVTEHEVKKPTGRIFLLFTRDEYEVCLWKPVLDKEKPSYSTDEYVIFIFDSYEDASKKLQSKI